MRRCKQDITVSFSCMNRLLTCGLAPVTVALRVKARVVPPVAVPPLATRRRVAEEERRRRAENLTSTVVCCRPGSYACVRYVRVEMCVCVCV